MTEHRDIVLDRPRLVTVIRLDDGTTSPRWELVAIDYSGAREIHDGDSGERLGDVLDALLDEPGEVAHIDLIVWMQA